MDGQRMPKHIILITGTPCIGKTTIAKMLTSKLNASYVNLTELATQENLVSGKDKKRGSIIVNENRMQRKIHEIIKNSTENTMIIDGHYVVSVVPKELVTTIFVLRRDPVELRKFMEKCGFSGDKLWENLASEILDVCLVDALNVHSKEKVCELDTTSKAVEEVVGEIMDVLNGKKKCHVGIVDWLGKLESEGLLDDYLKI